MSFEFLTALRTRTRFRLETDDCETSLQRMSVKSNWLLTSFGNVQCHAAGQGASVLIVPGLLGGSDLFMPMIAELAKSFRVHWFDWPGDRGFRESNGIRNVFRPQSILEDVIRATGERNVTVFGHSFGAWVAMNALGQGSLPQVDHLILSGAGLCESHRPADVFLRRLKRNKSFGSNDPIIAALAVSSLGSCPNNGSAYRRAIAAFTRTSPGSLAQRMNWMAEAKAHHTSVDNFASVTLLAAERDSVVPVHSQRCLAESIGADVASISGAGHLGILTHPALYAQAIASVIRCANDSQCRRVVSE